MLSCKIVNVLEQKRDLNQIHCILLQSMFMAILNDTYSEVVEEVENRREDFQVIIWKFVVVVV